MRDSGRVASVWRWDVSVKLCRSRFLHSCTDSAIFVILLHHGFRIYLVCFYGGMSIERIYYELIQLRWFGGEASEKYTYSVPRLYILALH